MSDPQPGNSSVKEQYAAQVVADLERNAKEQAQIGSQLAVLQDQLQSLRDDQAVLMGVQQALGLEKNKSGGSLARPRRRTAPGAGAKAAGVPKPRSTRSAKKPAPRVSKAVPGAQPTLVTLVQDYLAQQKEPRSASEVAEALGTAHPDRGIKKTVVRTTVEGLVAKGLAQRSKQGASVFYSAPDQAQSPDAGAEQEPATS
ncbi:hypothetical protein [Streptomyces sp. cg35]|uniref:hypothetical protein n=1 Tax=Streptomyces sp. cg35 TaxID=3421650 RepID=UPI003D16289E